MGKATLHLVRHAQGYHNLNTANHTLRDPDLTPFGEEQCRVLSKEFPAAYSRPPKITHLVASPLRRTLYTCLLSFPEEASRLVVTALPEVQETSDLPCDTGSNLAKLASEFEGKVDLSLVKEDWNSKKGRWSPTESAIQARAKDARIWLRNLASSALAESEGDVNIVVVTHGGYLHFLTEDWDGYNVKFVGTGWANTEFRAYEFENEEEEASIIETKESRERRRGDEQPLSKDEQKRLRDAAQKEALEKGYIGAEDAKL
ncbi:histidine phosphatase superfamily [Bisporella sp. PMI_857]|nr:histidine phosphatase superfamily [Bisporella sp. PMI_857]